MKHNPIETLTDEELITELQKRLVAQSRAHYLYVAPLREAEGAIVASWGDEKFFTAAILYLAKRLGESLQKSPLFNVVGIMTARSIAEGILEVMTDEED